LPALGVNGLSSSDLAEQLVRAALGEQLQQLFPGGEPERVDEPAGAVAEERGAMEAPARDHAGDGLPGGLGSAAATQ
jgi:hypothetical protein